MQLDVRRYGMVVPYLGAPGEFEYLVRVRLYDETGRRVYRTHLRCTAGVGSPGATSVVLGAVNNVKQLDAMSDQQVSDTFADVAYWCGQQLVMKMRRHAS
jgi:hypothetical protein